MVASVNSLPLDIALHPAEAGPQHDSKLVLRPLLPLPTLQACQPLLHNGVGFLLSNPQVRRDALKIADEAISNRLSTATRNTAPPGAEQLDLHLKELIHVKEKGARIEDAGYLCALRLHYHGYGIGIGEVPHDLGRVCHLVRANLLDRFYDCVEEERDERGVRVALRRLEQEREAAEGRVDSDVAAVRDIGGLRK